MVYNVMFDYCRGNLFGIHDIEHRHICDFHAKDNILFIVYYY